MRFIAAVVVVAATTAWAQRAPSPTGFGRNSNPAGVIGTTGGAGFGRMIYPGTGAPAVARNPRLPGSPVVALPPFPARHNAHATAVAAPYPVFYGGGYYDYEAPPAPVGPYPPADYQIPSGYEQMTQPPVVIINQYFRPDAANPVIRDYSNVPLPESQREAAPQASEPQVMFLIAMKDHTIFPAVAYWVDGDTLNYITVQGSKNSASLDLVDREFSQQINKERRVEFGLPSSAR
jgi:hypothetical protein